MCSACASGCYVASVFRRWVARGREHRGPGHELIIEVASDGRLGDVRGGRPKRRAANDLDSSQLVVFIRGGNVCLGHELLASASHATHVLYAVLDDSESQHDEEEKTTDNAGGGADGRLRELLGSFLNVLHAREAAIVIVVVAMQRTHVSREGLRPPLGVFHDVMIVGWCTAWHDGAGHGASTIARRPGQRSLRAAQGRLAVSR